MNEGKVSLKLEVSPEMAPGIQVVAYAILSSGNVIASSADFNTEKCFSHKVGIGRRPVRCTVGVVKIMLVINYMILT